MELGACRSTLAGRERSLLAAHAASSEAQDMVAHLAEQEQLNKVCATVALSPYPICSSSYTCTPVPRLH